ncbi:MAG TPA: TRASH domain-containing protein [Candidatus Methanoperedenaceae archaeon]|nr:TRASH domain-containing protein [Candidatus Methanoperedenaceae archaeon]
MPTVKARVDRMIRLGIINRFTVDLNQDKLDGIVTAIMVLSVKPASLNRVANELSGLPYVKELYITTDSDMAIVCKLVGRMEELLAIQGSLQMDDVLHLRVIPVNTRIKRDLAVPLSSSNISVTCSYCGKKDAESALRKRFEGTDYFFCCETCMNMFGKKFEGMQTGAQMRPGNAKSTAGRDR